MQPTTGCLESMEVEKGTSLQKYRCIIAVFGCSYEKLIIVVFELSLYFYIDIIRDMV